jgi:uncharacterized repeat protein (TIGR03917 family)
MDINITWTADGDTASDVVTFIGRIDGTAVTVATRPGASPGAPVVVLRTQSPVSGVLAAVRLVPDEAHRLAALLSSAALAAVGRAASRPTTGVPPPAVDEADPSGPALPAGPRIVLPRDDDHDTAQVRSRHVISAGEGSTAAEIRHALALLPVGARLVDFVSDTDVALIFSMDEQGWPPGGPDGGPIL